MDSEHATEPTVDVASGNGRATFQALPRPAAATGAPSRLVKRPLAALDWRELGAVFIGGALGALLRVWLARTFAGTSASAWPWVTFSINVSGSFLLGFLATRLQDRLPQSTYRRPLLGTGFCGAYTTFSTVQMEIVRMIEHHHYGLGVAYGLASITSGYLAVWIATALARRVRILV